MAITTTTWYAGLYSGVRNGSIPYTIAFADNTSGRWSIPNSRTISGTNVTVYWFSDDVNSYSFISSTWTNNAVGKSTIGSGEHLYVLGQNGGTYRTVTATGTMAVTPYTVNTGTRAITAKGVNGGLSTPSVQAGTTVQLYSTALTTAAANIATITAGDGIPSTGTLLSRGYSAGVWANWSWDSTVLSLASGTSTSKSITLNLLAGTADATITANFTTALNSSTTWRPGKGYNKVIVHILDDYLVEVNNSYSTSQTWSTFKALYMTAFTASSGADTAAWFDSTARGAYLLNVASATFAVTPKSGYSVYKWRLERPGGTDTTVYDNASVEFSDFAENNVLHLYLTSANKYPRIRYDGFDGTQPADTSAADPSGTYYPAGKVWASLDPNPFSLQLSPAAWAGQTLGLDKFVVIDGGAPVAIPSTSRSWTFTSNSDPYSVMAVKFKQSAAATTGTLTLDVVKDTATDDVSVSVAISQQGTLLGTLTADGTQGYYAGEGDIAVVVTPTYSNGATADQYTITLSITGATETDSVSGFSATLDATAYARTLTVTVTKIVHFGVLSGVAINVTRDTTNGTEAVSTTGSTLQATQGSVVVTFTSGQASSLPLHISCSPGAGYSLRRILVTDGGGTPYIFATVGAKTEQDITLTVPYSKDGTNIKVILVVIANMVPTPVVNPLNAYDQGKFAATITGASDGQGGYYGDFRTGDLVTVTVTPVMYSSAYMTGMLVGSLQFNGVGVAGTRTTNTLTVQVPLTISANVFTVAMYAVLETAYTAGTSPAPTITVTWSESDSITLSAVTYYRLGLAFTIGAEKIRGSNTGVSVTSALRAVVSGFTYVTDSVLPFDTLTTDATLGASIFILKGAQKTTINYAAGVQYPTVAMAVYNYQSSSYITAGARPVITITPASGVTLTENTVGAWSAPTPNPGTDYTGAVFLVRQVTSTALFPTITVSASPGTGRLEIWDGTEWLPRETRTETMVDATTFARWAVGTPPSGLVDFSIGSALLSSGAAMPAAVKVYVASAADNIDKTVYAPSVLKVSKNAAVGISVVTPPGFVFIEWQIDGVVVKGISASVIVHAAVSAVPIFAVATTFGAVPMILGGSGTEYDEGVWVSKLFRAQWPWKPLVATVIKENYESATELAVNMGTEVEMPSGMFEDSDTNARISIVDGKMRRLPPANMQKSRFVRYGLKVNGREPLLSVAIATGAQTMKGGH